MIYTTTYSSHVLDLSQRLQNTHNHTYANKVLLHGSGYTNKQNYTSDQTSIIDLQSSTKQLKISSRSNQYREQVLLKSESYRLIQHREIQRRKGEREIVGGGRGLCKLTAMFLMDLCLYPNSGLVHFHIYKTGRQLSVLFQNLGVVVQASYNTTIYAQTSS